MSFCASCGRQRSGTARFCGGCGAEFKDPADTFATSASSSAPDDQGTRPADAVVPDGPTPDMTRMDLHPEAPEAALTGPPAEPDPFADWYSPRAGGDGAAEAAGYGAGAQWPQTQTVGGTPTQAPGYPPSAFNPAPPPPPGFPPSPSAAPPSRGGGMKGLFIVVAVVVVLAAGGGAYALATSLGKHPTAQPPTQSTAGASTPATGTTPSSGTSASASTSPSTSPSASPSPTLSLVAISPNVTASAAEPQVETLLSHYFHGINTHDYAEYAGTLTAQQQVKQPKSAFDSGYSSTTDSGMTLTGLSDSGAGGLTAAVTFTSHQSPSQSVDNSACNAWTLNLYLVPQGTGYLIGPAPSGYQPVHSDC
jgi:hypothetical protein